jgi:hypothetical protein
MDAPSAPLRIAAVLNVLNGLGFGVFIPFSIARLVQRNEILRVMGLPTYGEGPFQQHGLETTVPLLTGFLLVNLLLVVSGILVWNGQRFGAILGLITLVPGAVYWWGFALPFGPLLGLGAAILVLTSWSHLS